MNVALIGFMGTGKSTIAKYMHSEFGMEVVEMDQIIAEREGCTIAEIFAQKGEEYFRKKETELLKEVQVKDHVILSCGGGVALRNENISIIKENGNIVLLTASPDTIYERVKAQEDRPLLKGKMNVEAIKELMETRRTAYENAADIIVETDGKSAAQICEEIREKLEKDGNV